MTTVSPDKPQCILCVGECRGHSLEEWKLEPSSREALASTPDKDELLPCPFCGSRAAVLKRDLWWRVCCARCGSGTGKRLASLNTRAEAIAAWNTRAAPSPAPDKDEVELALDDVVKMARQYQAAVIRMPEEVYSAGQRLQQAKCKLLAAMSPVDNQWDAGHAAGFREGVKHGLTAPVDRLREALRDLADAARNSCDANRYPALTEALFEADTALSSPEPVGEVDE